MSSAPDSARRFAINAASSVVTRLLQITVLVWVNQYLIKRIAPAEYSILPMVMALVVFADFLKHIFTGGLGRYIVEADAQKDNVGVTRIVSSMMPILALATALLMLLGAIVAWQIDAVINLTPDYVSDARLMLLLLLGNLGLNLLTAPFTVGPYVRQRFTALNVIDLGCEALRVGLLLALLLGVSPRVMWLVVASTCGGVLNVVLRYGLTRRDVPAIRFQRNLVSWEKARSLMHFGAWTSLQGVTDLMASSVPLLMLNRFGTALDVASFHLGRMPDVQIRRLTSAASSPAQPALTRLYARGATSELHELYYRGGRYHLWAALLLVAPLLVFGAPLVRLYAGPDYLPAATVFFAMLVVYPVLWASAMFYRVAHAMGKVRNYYLIDVLIQVTILAVLAGLAWDRRLTAGETAIAIAVVQAVLYLLLCWPIGLRQVQGEWKLFFNRTLIPGLLPFGAALLLCLLGRAVLSVDSWWRLGAVSAIALVGYVTVLLVCCLDAQDRQLVARLVRRVQGKFGRNEPRLQSSAVKPTVSS
jgi:O-antigen/teichoic acid export membrane protein